MPMIDLSTLPVWANGAMFLGAALVVWRAGVNLTAYLDAIAGVTGIDRAFVGMLLLGGVTSLPEIATVATASLAGNAVLATNNLLGSVSINVVLIAAADAVLGRGALTSLVPSPTTMLQGSLLIIALALLALAILTGDVGFLGVGAWPIALFAYCIAAFWLASRYSARAPWRAVDLAEGVGVPHDQQVSAEDEAERSLRTLSAKALAAAVAILFAGYVLSLTGDVLAQQTGIGSAFAGLILVGFATSLPELSTITAAIRLGRYEMALGDVFGTNLLTITLFLLADIFYSDGPILQQAGRFEIGATLVGLILTAIFLVGLLRREKRTFLRMGYDALAALVVFAAGLAVLYSLRS